MARVVDKSWSHIIYVASDKSLLKSIVENNEILSMIKEYNFLSEFELVTDTKRSQFLEMELKDPIYTLKISRKM